MKKLSVVLLGAIALSVLALFAVVILPGSGDTRKVYTPKPDPLNIRPKRGRPIPPLDFAAALSGSPDQLTKGKAIYTAQCASCHGTEGYGNGPAGRALNPPPRNFSVSKEWQNGYRITDIFDTLTNGLKQMPAFDYLTPAERFAVAHYVQSLGDFDHGAEREDARDYLQEKYNVSKGGRAPHKVSIDFAIKQLEEEQNIPKLEMPVKNDQSKEAQLLRNSITDPKRAAYTFNLLPQVDNPLQALADAAPTNGFSPSIALLTDEESELLMEALRKRLEKVKGGNDD